MPSITLTEKYCNYTPKEAYYMSILRIDIIKGDNRTHRFINWAENFINFAYLSLVLQIDWGIEIGYLLMCELCDSVTFTCMNKCRNLCTRKFNKPCFKHKIYLR